MMGCDRQLVITAAIVLVANLATSAEDFNFPAQFGEFDNNEGNNNGLDPYTEMGRIDNSFAFADDQLIRTDKRMPSFSVNGGLRSLTDMLYSRERANMASGRSGIRNTLLKLGKRSWENLGEVPSGTASDDADSNQASLEMNKRHSQQLSVSGPLSALANMLAAEGRRRQFTESRHNRMRLLQLGKRSNGLARLSTSVGKFSSPTDNDVELYD